MASGDPICRSLWVQWILVQVFPRLRSWGVPDWTGILRKANAGEFDRLEQIGTLVVVIIAASIVRPMRAMDSSAWAVFIASLVLAGIVLVLGLLPFFVRRIRRGLAELDKQRENPNPPSAAGNR